MSFGAGILLPQRYTNNTTGPGTLHLDFQTGAPLDSRVTFTRSTTATFVGSNGLIQSAAINTPRFDYNPATLAPQGLLIEEQRVNLLLYSEQFSPVNWIAANTTFTPNTTTSPDGLLTAGTLVEAATTGSHTLRQQITGTSGIAYTASVFAKASTRSQVALEIYTGATVYRVIVDLTNGSFVSSVGTGSYAIIAFGNGWYKISATAVSTSTAINVFFYTASGNSISYTGNGVSGVHIWGAQLEVGSFPTSYIPTINSTVTRAADVAMMTGTNFSSWYNASEGTFVASFEASPNTYTTYLAASNGTVAQNSMHMDNDGSGNMRAAYYSGSSAVALLSLGAVGTLNVVNKVATAYKVNDFAASRNGGAVVTDTAGAVPVGVVQLNIGADPSGAAVNVSNTHIRSITYYPSRLTNVELQALSS